MSLLTLIVALVVVGIVLYAINAFVPMEGSVKRILNIVVICILVIWILQAFGLLDFLNTVHVGKAHR